MLRQALDAAAQQREEGRTPLISSPRGPHDQQRSSRSEGDGDNSNNDNDNTNDGDGREQRTRTNNNYGATYSGDGYEEGNEYGETKDDNDGDDKDDQEDDDDDDDDDELYMLNVWQSQGSSVPIVHEMSLMGKVWEAMKSCFMLVVNVENLWDSPTTSQGREISRRNHCVVLFWFFILAVSYTGERTTFKLLVDRTGPFRLFSVEMATFTHAFMVGLGMLLSAVYRHDFTMQSLGIPVVDVGLMALLDTVHMLLVFLTGYHVAPTLTVILVQFTIPLTALISQFVHPDGYFKRCCGQTRRSDLNEVPTSTNLYEHDNNVGQPFPGSGGLSIEHIIGSIIISLAVLLALCPSIYTLVDQDFFVYADAIPIQTAYNSILFVSSCLPAAASQLYKEHIFLQYKQPVQPDYLNFVLSVFQFVFASIMSPLVYTLLGFATSDDWPKLYPSSEFSKNFADGFRCYSGTLESDRAENGYPDEATCDGALLLVCMYAFSVISVGVAVDKIVNAGGK
jgi:hypothetical protein